MICYDIIYYNIIIYIYITHVDIVAEMPRVSFIYTYMYT